MIALVFIAFAAGIAVGWFVRGLFVRQMWKASLRFRRAAMGFSRMKGGDDIN
jgi:uncharacterized membrane protein YciS (DUF1049 family)